MLAWHTLTAHCLHEEAGLAKHVHLGGCLSGVCNPDACAHKTTATAIFMPVSHAWQPCAGLQWRKASQPARFIPYIDCAQ